MARQGEYMLVDDSETIRSKLMQKYIEELTQYKSLTDTINNLNEAELGVINGHITAQDKEVSKYTELQSKYDNLQLSEIINSLKELHKLTNIEYIYTRRMISDASVKDILAMVQVSLTALKGDVKQKIDTYAYPAAKRKYLKYKTKYLTLRDKLIV